MVDGRQARVLVEILTVREVEQVTQRSPNEAAPRHTLPPVVCRVLLSPVAEDARQPEQGGSAH